MPSPGQSWTLHVKVVACVFHVFAIISGIFRIAYRWYITRFGWDDTWATVALLADIGCLICVWAQRSVPLHLSHTDTNLNWVAVTTLNSTPWAARISMVTTIIRIANPRAGLRRMSYAVALVFASMWVALLVPKMYDCGTRSCKIPHIITILQLLMDGIADTFLVLMPILLMKDVKISQSQRVLLVSSFASSIGITVVSIAQGVSVFFPLNSTSLLLTHIKAAFSVIVCNLLVVVTFVYQVYHKIDIDGETSKESEVQFSTLNNLAMKTCSVPE